VGNLRTSRFNIQKYQALCRFSINFKTNNAYFPLLYEVIGFYKQEQKCFHCAVRVELVIELVVVVVVVVITTTTTTTINTAFLTPSCTMSTGSIFGIKRPELGVDHPPHIALS
jgi:hypothetical protein